MISRSDMSRQIKPGLGTVPVSDTTQDAGPERARKGRAGKVGGHTPNVSGAAMQGGDTTQHRNTMGDGAGKCGYKNTL